MQWTRQRWILSIKHFAESGIHIRRSDGKPPYLHTYQGCNRFDGYTLDEAYTMGVPDLVYGSQPAPQFWYTSMSNQGIVEKAFTFMFT